MIFKADYMCDSFSKNYIPMNTSCSLFISTSKNYLTVEVTVNSVRVYYS